MIETVQAIDATALPFFNQVMGQSKFIDMGINFISDNHLLKGVPLMMLFWGLWFSEDRLGPETRPRLAALLVTNIVAIAAGRAFATFLPARLRPLQDPDIIISTPAVGADWDGWSSMPSDHAVMFFAMATAFFFVNRWAGIAALVHAIVIVSLPRIMLGVHFPTDILAGAAIGVIVALLLMPPLSRLFVKRQTVERALAYPYFTYPVLFFVTFQCASMFDSLRRFLGSAADAVQHIL